MISKQEIEKARSPRGLRQFVVRRVNKIRGIKNQRHKAMLKKGLYKIFSDEIVPLSIFCLKNYPNTYVVQPVIGNQGYDAVVRDDKDKIVEYVELTLPHDGSTAAKDARLVVSRGYGKIDVYEPGENLKRMFSFILKACHKKSQKDYSDCSLVICVNFVPPFPEHKTEYTNCIKQMIEEIHKLSFKAKKVYLLVMPFKKVISIFG